MKEKRKIGIDIDEVVIEFFKKYLESFNQRFNKKINFEDLENYHVWDLTGVSKEDSLILAHEIHNSEHPDTIDLVDGVKEALTKLSKTYKIYFITSRPEQFKEKTRRLLKDIFKNFEFSLHLSGGVWEKAKTKGEICQELGVTTMIEDNSDYALDCAEKGIKTFLLDKPWNKKYRPHENLIKVKNWLEIIERLE